MAVVSNKLSSASDDWSFDFDWCNRFTEELPRSLFSISPTSGCPVVQYEIRFGDRSLATIVSWHQ
jgi:hypothetical protein